MTKHNYVIARKEKENLLSEHSAVRTVKFNIIPCTKKMTQTTSRTIKVHNTFASLLIKKKTFKRVYHDGDN